MPEDLATVETSRLISSTKVHGTAVYSREGERLGTINSVMIDKRSGQVEYVVVGFGGLFGLGGEHHPLPWQVLTYEPTRRGYVAHLSKEALGKAPSYTDDEEETLYDPAFERALYSYYGLPLP
jgi:sporulation protein YlmC with PRC-barrel domain